MAVLVVVSPMPSSVRLGRTHTWAYDVSRLPTTVS